MLIDRNNLHDLDYWIFFKWMFKTACAILILSNTFNIVMAVFDVSQSVIASAAGLVQGSTDISADMLTGLRTTLEAMELGPLLGLFSSDLAVLDAAVRYTWWVLPFIWTYAVFNCMMSFVNGTGAVKYTTVVNLLILWAVRIPAAYILHALGYGTSSMACVSLSYAVGLVAMLGYFLTPEWGKLRRKAKELGDAVTAETEPTL